MRPTPRPGSRYLDQRARVELLGSIGAGVLGAGLALLFRQWLATLALPFLVIGGTVHGLAMYRKRRLDAFDGTPVPRWTEWTYWLCWLLLMALAAYVWLVRT